MVLQTPCEFNYREAECLKIDHENKKVYCKSSQESKLGKKEEFAVDYDYLVVSVGGLSNTFGTPGVEEHALFLKVTYLNYQNLFPISLEVSAQVISFGRICQALLLV